MAQILKGFASLRRDNDYNYQKNESTFIPLKGEVCLVDTARNGLRAKIGDGRTSFKELQFIDEDISRNILIKGYLHDNQFYSDVNCTLTIEASVNKIYFNNSDGSLYTFDGKNYFSVTQTITAATAIIPGIMKLYDTVGDNTDGTMTQKAITDELNEKVEIDTDVSNELLTFIIN